MGGLQNASPGFMQGTIQTSDMLENMSKAGKEQAQRAAELLERLRRVLPPPTAGRGFSSS